MEANFIEFEKWKKTITLTQMIIVGLAFITELAGNIMLYVTRSQGYSPETIVAKLLRYLVLTTVINIFAVVLGQYLIRKVERIEFHKYVLIISTEIICINVAYSHYQFTIAFGIFAIPIIVSILYEDRILTHWAMIIGLLGLTLSVLKRGSDPDYNQDIGPEAIIAYAIIISIYCFSKLCIDTMVERRKRLNEAMLNGEKAKYVGKVEDMSFQMLNTLAQAIDAKDRYTNGHSFRVAEYAVMLAEKMGYSEEEKSELKKEALLHDIGKIGVPDSVLNKPGRLTNIEFKVMQSHTTVGANILSGMIFVPGASTTAEFHHEKFDGTGYPKGISGKNIPEHARIVGIADAYDAMSSDRIYRRALSSEQIREQFTRGSGTQFDPDILEIFLQLMDNDELIIKDRQDGQDYVPTENMALDLQQFISDISVNGKYEGALSVDYNDFSILYEYVKNMGRRYGHSFEIVMLLTQPIESADVTETDMENAARAMELSIRKNIRTVDIYTRYSRTQHIAILLDAEIENVDTIIQRIFLDFYKLNDNRKFELSYETS